MDVRPIDSTPTAIAISSSNLPGPRKRAEVSASTTSLPRSASEPYEPKSTRNHSVSATSKYVNQFALNTIPWASHSW
jgi:hypothetical protein